MPDCSRDFLQEESDFMRIRNTIPQIAMGAFPIMLLWCIASHYGELYSDVYLDSSATKLAVNCLNSLGIIPVVLIASAFIYKRYSMKISFITSVVVIVLPVIGVVCNDAFSDDGNILSWIFAFTLAIPMYPFVVVGCNVFECGNWYCSATGRGYLDYDLMYLCFFNLIMISVLIFTLVKSKEIKTSVEQKTIGTVHKNFFNR